MTSISAGPAAIQRIDMTGQVEGTKMKGYKRTASAMIRLAVEEEERKGAVKNVTNNNSSSMGTKEGTTQGSSCNKARRPGQKATSNRPRSSTTDASTGTARRTSRASSSGRGGGSSATRRVSRPAQGTIRTNLISDIRKQQIENVSYALKLMIYKGKSYNGVVHIKFDRTEQLSDTDLVIDFRGVIESVTFNDKFFDTKAIQDNYQGAFFRVPAADVKVGSNTVTISFSNLYETDGTGLHHYIDPTDNKQYLYT